jgi:chromosome segregation ATPase
VKLPENDAVRRWVESICAADSGVILAAVGLQLAYLEARSELEEAKEYAKRLEDQKAELQANLAEASHAVGRYRQDALKAEEDTGKALEELDRTKRALEIARAERDEAEAKIEKATTCDSCKFEELNMNEDPCEECCNSNVHLPKWEPRT